MQWPDDAPSVITTDEEEDGCISPPPHQVLSASPSSLSRRGVTCACPSFRGSARLGPWFFGSFESLTF